MKTVTLTVLTTLGFLLPSLAVGADPAEPSALAFVRVDVPDGKAWVLGDGGVGRPFMARLLLVNRGKEPVTIWDYKNSEGSQCPGVILTDAQGTEIALRPPPIPRLAGVPTVITIQPHQVIAIELELLRLIGERGLPPGSYKLKGLYENRLKDTGMFMKAEVWTGRIESEAVDITVVAPKLSGATGSKTSLKGWELYVWQDGGETHFALLVGTNRLKTEEEIAQAAVKGFAAIKPQIDQLQPGQYLFVQSRRLAAPAPEGQANAVAEYCCKIGLDVQPRRYDSISRQRTIRFPATTSKASSPP